MQLDTCNWTLPVIICFWPFFSELVDCLLNDFLVTVHKPFRPSLDVKFLEKFVAGKEKKQGMVFNHNQFLSVYSPSLFFSFPYARSKQRLKSNSNDVQFSCQSYFFGQELLKTTLQGLAESQSKYLLCYLSSQILPRISCLIINMIETLTFEICGASDQTVVMGRAIKGI